MADEVRAGSNVAGECYIGRDTGGLDCGEVASQKKNKTDWTGHVQIRFWNQVPSESPGMRPTWAILNHLAFVESKVVQSVEPQDAMYVNMGPILWGHCGRLVSYYRKQTGGAPC